MIRYRYARDTQHTILKFEHIARLGRLLSIEGRRYRAKLKGYGGGTVVREGVLVKGLNGTARFNSVLWGYKGSGPHGLIQLLQVCGIPRDVAEDIAFNTPRRLECGTDWLITFPKTYTFQAAGQTGGTFYLVNPSRRVSKAVSRMELRHLAEKAGKGSKPHNLY